MHSLLRLLPGVKSSLLRITISILTTTIALWRMIISVNRIGNHSRTTEAVSTSSEGRLRIEAATESIGTRSSSEAVRTATIRGTGVSATKSTIVSSVSVAGGYRID